MAFSPLESTSKAVLANDQGSIYKLSNSFCYLVLLASSQVNANFRADRLTWISSIVSPSWVVLCWVVGLENRYHIITNQCSGLRGPPCVLTPRGISEMSTWDTNGKLGHPPADTSTVWPSPLAGLLTSSAWVLSLVSCVRPLRTPALAQAPFPPAAPWVPSLLFRGALPTSGRVWPCLFIERKANPHKTMGPYSVFETDFRGSHRLTWNLREMVGSFRSFSERQPSTCDRRKRSVPRMRYLLTWP